MNMLNVIANSFSVPLLLSDEGKKAAIASRVVSAAEGAGDGGPTSDRLAHARVALDYFLPLGSDIEDVLGGYAIGNRAEHVVRGVPSDAFNENERRAYARVLLERVVAHLAAEPRDVGELGPR